MHTANTNFRNKNIEIVLHNYYENGRRISGDPSNTFIDVHTIHNRHIFIVIENNIILIKKNCFSLLKNNQILLSLETFQ